MCVVVASATKEFPKPKHPLGRLWPPGATRTHDPESAMPRIMSVLVGKIAIGKRHRKDMGDLQELAQSIEAEGLLHPIGITPKNELIFGERRLRAVAEILGQDSIEAKVVKVSSIAAGEYAENEVRKDFTASERVAIGQTLEGELDNRQGQRTDLELPGRCPEVQPGQETREVLAQKVGFGNAREHERAKAVVAKGSKPLIEAMDRGDLPVSTAAKLADLPKADQAKALKGGKQAIQEAITAAKPAPAFPAFEQFENWLTHVTFGIGMIEKEYGSLTKMVKNPKWHKRRTQEAADFLKVTTDAMNKFNTEMKGLCQ